MKQRKLATSVSYIAIVSLAFNVRLIAGVCTTPEFQLRNTYAVGMAPIATVVGDFNLDGKPDLATANSDSDNVSILLGNGDGSFRASVTFGTGGGRSTSRLATSIWTASLTWRSRTTTVRYRFY